MPNHAALLKQTLDEEWIELQAQERASVRALQTRRQDYLLRRRALVGLLGPLATAIRLSAHPDPPAGTHPTALSPD